MWCNNLWKWKWKDIAGPVSAFEVNSLMQRVTVNDCHPCSVHPMPWSKRDFTGVHPRIVLARPQWPLVSRQLPQRGGVVCFGSFRSHKWKRDPDQLEAPLVTKVIVWHSGWRKNEYPSTHWQLQANSFIFHNWFIMHDWNISSILYICISRISVAVI